MKKEANAKNVKYLEEYSRGDAEVLVVPVDDEGFIPYSKLRYYLRMNFWDSALEARIQSIAGKFHDGDAYLYRNSGVGAFRAQLFVPSNADLTRVFSEIFPEYKSVALPYKRGHSVLHSMGTVPRGMAYSYYAV